MSSRTLRTCPDPLPSDKRFSRTLKPRRDDSAHPLLPPRLLTVVRRSGGVSSPSSFTIVNLKRGETPPRVWPRPNSQFRGVAEERTPPLLRDLAATLPLPFSRNPDPGTNFFLGDGDFCISPKFPHEVFSQKSGSWNKLFLGDWQFYTEERQSLRGEAREKEREEAGDRRQEAGGRENKKRADF